MTELLKKNFSLCSRPKRRNFQNSWKFVLLRKSNKFYFSSKIYGYQYYIRIIYTYAVCLLVCYVRNNYISLNNICILRINEQNVRKLSVGAIFFISFYFYFFASINEQVLVYYKYFNVFQILSYNRAFSILHRYVWTKKRCQSKVLTAS